MAGEFEKCVGLGVEAVDSGVGGGWSVAAVGAADAFGLAVEEEEFGGVVAGFVVDVDVAGVVGGFVGGVPPGVGEPAAFGCEVEAVGGLVRRERSVGRDVADDAADGVVDHRKGLAVVEVGVEHAVDAAGLEQAELAQDAVGVDDVAGGGDGIVAEDEHGVTKAAQGGEMLENLAQAFGVGAFALKVVVERGEVRQTEVGLVLADEVGGDVDDPAGGGVAGERAPVAVEGKGALDERGGLAGAGFDERAVVFVDRRGGDDVVGGFAEALLPADDGDGFAFGAHGFPDARAAHEAGGLFPVEGAVEFGTVDAVELHAVFGRGECGAEAALHRAGECRVDRLHRHEVECRELARESVAETRDLDDEEFVVVHVEALEEEGRVYCLPVRRVTRRARVTTARTAAGSNWQGSAGA